MRILHQLYAWLAGYFWLACPVCGRMFGGHEHHGWEALLSAPHRGKQVCSDACSDRARVINGYRLAAWQRAGVWPTQRARDELADAQRLSQLMYDQRDRSQRPHIVLLPGESASFLISEDSEL